ncbi:hypothetical protein LEP1GSC079_4575 [Leptospira interrogans str. FPW1039]|uniref:Uncharacterized protein n=1 Tax=Leptospira interrogans str. FPW1039 TaxID=1193040 RepID=A0A0F6IA20_LEPIR|nr:hypothetical protein LEP1GSC069_0253 [Leptospira interrogans serovar Canicola str. Fiocruz LV133]EMJ34895.1 hypothetical protein LEP1GSC079_4575 [Leptospira interrogans str. FPW1039]EMK19727.1 hypothetical protein LEP1GSC075_0435 [Leptospira interrogans str. Kito]EMN97188.1 hypothetical protein LEP1GSC110_1752 [Leptospira interrogans serovar Medanensis str. UT053]EMO01051.1 hypothetical protein LEP1GSC112_0409 [Leptospira interrogans serovar Pomona str. UT364]
MDLVYPSATRDQGSTEDNGLNMIQNFSNPSILPAKKYGNTYPTTLS